MPRDRKQVGACATCGADGVECLHNRFENPLHRIDAWEHRCANCGERSTEAFRKPADEPEPDLDPLVCPFCGRRVPLG